MRVLIIGLGSAGAAAAWRLAQAGHSVMALEQFRHDHDLGSSYGESRIIRRVYPDPLYTGLMADAYPLWDELSAETPWRDLIRLCGGIYVGRRDNPLVIAAESALKSSGVPYEVLEGAACSRRFPAFPLREDRSEIALFDPDMGYVRATDSVRAMARLAQKRGAKIIEANPVSEIALTASGVRVVVDSGETFEADRLIVAAGAWTNALLAPFGIRLPLTVTRQVYAHLQTQRGLDLWRPRTFPVWIDADANAYGLPRLGDAVSGVKIGLHHHGEPTTPETVGRELTEEDRAAIRNYAAGRFPWIGPETTYEKVCLYTNTPDEDFIVDRAPGLPNILIVSACSGHGFKFAPLVGEIAARLATDAPMDYDLSRFRIARFASS